MKKQEKAAVRLLANNRRARREYHIEDTFEAGIVLSGTEVKSLRAGKIQLKDSYVEIRDGEAYLIGTHIGAYEQGNRANHDPERPRKLLLHRREIDKLFGRGAIQGRTVVPLKVYLKGHLVKIEIGLARGKKLYDKRLDEKKRVLDREAEEALKSHR